MQRFLMDDQFNIYLFDREGNIYKEFRPKNIASIAFGIHGVEGEIRRELSWFAEPKGDITAEAVEKGSSRSFHS